MEIREAGVREELGRRRKVGSAGAVPADIVVEVTYDNVCPSQKVRVVLQGPMGPAIAWAPLDAPVVHGPHGEEPEVGITKEDRQEEVPRRIVARVDATA